jgi:menaquinone-dependent protoporphyrinogen oxidase
LRIELNAQDKFHMKRILVAYATLSGSTRDVAHAVAEEIAKCGLQVDVLPLDEVEDIENYAGVVVGAPMIMGWHRGALRFLKNYRQALQDIPLAVFVMAMSLTQTSETRVDGVPVYLDEELAKPPQKEGHLDFRERYARLSPYLRPILRAVHPAKPASVAVFGGRLDYGRLKWWAVLFVAVIIQAPAEDRRNWTAIRSWAANLPSLLHIQALEADRVLT